MRSAQITCSAVLRNYCTHVTNASFLNLRYWHLLFSLLIIIIIILNIFLLLFKSHARIFMEFIVSGNFSIHFWRQYMSLYASITAIVSLLLTSDRKSSRWRSQMLTDVCQGKDGMYHFKIWHNSFNIFAQKIQIRSWHFILLVVCLKVAFIIALFIIFIKKVNEYAFVSACPSHMVYSDLPLWK